jgi:hypothetical protein
MKPHRNPRASPTQSSAPNYTCKIQAVAYVFCILNLNTANNPDRPMYRVFLRQIAARPSGQCAICHNPQHNALSPALFSIIETNFPPVSYQTLFAHVTKKKNRRLRPLDGYDCIYNHPVFFCALSAHICFEAYNKMQKQRTGGEDIVHSSLIFYGNVAKSSSLQPA